MPAKPTPKALTITGETAMIAVHAVVDLATCSSDRPARAELRGRLAELVREVDLLPDVEGRDVYRALTVTLARLLHRSVDRLAAQGHLHPAPEEVLRERLRSEEPSIQELTVGALGVSVGQFIAAIGYGSETPADPVEVGIAAAAALRLLLDCGVVDDDPLMRWRLLARVTNAVMAKHYVY